MVRLGAAARVLAGQVGQIESINDLHDEASQVIAALAKIGTLVDSKAPAEAAGFKAWLQHTAEKVAEASAEGGFMGFGGVQVTDAEKASIAEVASALKI